jgi:putative transposase
MQIHAGSINRDHVHVLLSIPPNLSVSRAVQHLKGKKFTQAVVGVCEFAKAVLGTTSMGAGLLGLFERQRH